MSVKSIPLSVYKGAWSNAALVVSAIANGGAAKLAIAHYGFKSDEEWAKAMQDEITVLLKAARKETK